MYNMHLQFFPTHAYSILIGNAAHLFDFSIGISTINIIGELTNEI